MKQQRIDYKLSLCPFCYCMTKNILKDDEIWCGKCKQKKDRVS